VNLQSTPVPVGGPIVTVPQGGAADVVGLYAADVEDPGCGVPVLVGLVEGCGVVVFFASHTSVPTEYLPLIGLVSVTEVAPSPRIVTNSRSEI